MKLFFYDNRSLPALPTGTAPGKMPVGTVVSPPQSSESPSSAPAGAAASPAGAAGAASTSSYSIPSAILVSAGSSLKSDIGIGSFAAAIIIGALFA